MEIDIAIDLLDNRAYFDPDLYGRTRSGNFIVFTVENIEDELTIVREVWSKGLGDPSWVYGEGTVLFPTEEDARDYLEALYEEAA